MPDSTDLHMINRLCKRRASFRDALGVSGSGHVVTVRAVEMWMTKPSPEMGLTILRSWWPAPGWFAN